MIGNETTTGALIASATARAIAHVIARAIAGVIAGVIACVSVAIACLNSVEASGADMVTGTVVDAAGKPVQGARVGSSLTVMQKASDTKVQIGYDASDVLTDASGRFSIPAAPIGYTHVLVAAGPDGSLGFASKASPAATQIRLFAPAKLKIALLKPFGHRVPHTFDLVSGGSSLGYASLRGSSAEFAVPQGSYELGLSDPESTPVSLPLQLTSPLEKQVRLELRPTLWARNLGKPAPPFTPTEVQNWPAGRSLASLKGKWVLVSFWATWCRPCVEEMPKLIRFYEQHPRDRFEILAVHSEDGGASFAAIRPAYDRFVKGPWGGQSLPFPMLFDSTGNTQKKVWGINAYPTTLLIDPAGNLVGLATLEDLRSKLEK